MSPYDFSQSATEEIAQMKKILDMEETPEKDTIMLGNTSRKEEV